MEVRATQRRSRERVTSDQLPASRLTNVYRLDITRAEAVELREIAHGGCRPGGVTYETYLVE